MYSDVRQTTLVKYFISIYTSPLPYVYYISSETLQTLVKRIEFIAVTFSIEKFGIHYHCDMHCDFDMPWIVDID